MIELHGGYISGALIPLALGLSQPLKWSDILKSYCQFVVDSDILPNKDVFPELTVFENLIARGMPTLPSLRVEQWLAEITNLTVLEAIGERDKHTGRFITRLKIDADKNFCNKLEYAWCLPAPEATISESVGFTLPEFDSKAEKKFWDGPLRLLLGTGLMQLVERQRPLMSIVDDLSFAQQRVDFSVELPGCDGINLEKGLVIEFDGDHHLPLCQYK